MHSWRRTILKALTYRIASFGIGTYGTSAFFKLPIALTAGFGLILMAINFGLFIANELGWRRTSFGKPKE